MDVLQWDVLEEDACMSGRLEGVVACECGGGVERVC